MKKISAYDLTENVFDLLNRQWALVTTRAGEKTNTMTASWGGLGILWNMPVATIYVRPQRYTKEMLENSERFSLCFLPKSFLQEKNYCGKLSGRDVNKLADCSLQTTDLDETLVLSDSTLALTCRKLYVQQLTPQSFTDTTIAHAHYPYEDYHFMYLAQILGVYVGKNAADFYMP